MLKEITDICMTLVEQEQMEIVDIEKWQPEA